MRRLVTLVAAARALAPSHLTPAQMKRYAKVEAQLRDEPRSTPVLVDGNNVRATLGWTRTTAEVQALVDDWAVATSRRCVTCWDYGDAFAASETSGGAAVFSGRDVFVEAIAVNKFSTDIRHSCHGRRRTFWLTSWKRSRRG